MVFASPYLLVRSLVRPDEMRERMGRWQPLPPGARGSLWLHAASVGEARAVTSFLSELSRHGESAMLSVVTPAARRLEREFVEAGASSVRCAPLDFTPFVRSTLRQFHPRGILIVDDCPEDRERLRQLLSSWTDVEFRIFAAETAEGALDLLDREDVDCLLLDYNLPDADGVELLRNLRGGPYDRNLGIIILTGVGNELVAAEAFRRGADDYLPKPSITRRTLREAVDRTIEQRRHGRKVQDSGI